MSNSIFHQSVATILTDGAAVRRDVAVLADSVNSIISLLRIVAQQLDKSSQFKEAASGDLVSTSTIILSKTDLDTRMTEFEHMLAVILAEYKDLVIIS